MNDRPYGAMLVAEDLLLLAYHDTRGVVHSGTNLDHAVAAAVLAELTSHGTMTVSPDPVPVIRVRSTALLGNEVLDRWIRNADEHRGVRVDQMVREHGPSLRTTLLERLAARGALRRGRGVLPKERWLSSDPGFEQQVRDRLYDVLVRGITPDTRTATLIVLLRAFQRVDNAVERGDVTPAQKRAAAVTVPESIGKIIHAAANAAEHREEDNDWNIIEGILNAIAHVT